MSTNLVGKIILGLVLSLCQLADAMEWHQLDLMRKAIQETTYRGEYMHRRGDKTSVYSVVHRYLDGKSEELLRQLDGDMVEVLRTGDRLICYYPEGSEGALSQAVPAAPYSQVDALDLSQIAKNYQAVSVGMARVAGLQTHIIELTGDDSRYSHRFWLEAETNLLLQSEIIDGLGNILEQFRYTRIELGIPISDADVTPSLVGDSSARQQTMFRTESSKVDDQSFLSRLNWLPPGYELTNANRREENEGWIEQRTYSDGLTSFSVFAESKLTGSSQPMAVAKMGATTALMMAINGLSVTVIGEVPTKTAKQIGQMLSVEEVAL